MTNVTHLCYIFINNYKNLSNIGLAIDPRYKFEFDPDKKVLNIERQNILPKDFWGQGIYSLTGIFGNNGAGKSTSIRFILEAIVYGSGAQSVDGIIVCEIDNCLHIYRQDEDIKVTYAGDYETTKKTDDINPFYYSGYFVPNFNYNNMLSNQLGTYYNASISCRFFNDIGKFANTTDDYRTIPISTYIVSYNSQNNYRICNLLIDDKLCKNIEGLKFPRYVIFGPNRGGQNHFKFHFKTNNQLKGYIKQYIEEPAFSFTDEKDKTLAQFIHHCILNGMAESAYFTNAFTLFNDWYSFLDQEKEVLPQLHEFIDTRTDKGEARGLRIIEQVLTKLNECIRINDFGGFYLDFNKDKKEILDLIETAQENNIYSATRFFDLYYSHEKNGNTTLSSGEQAMLNLFSLIYDAVVTQAQNSYSALSLLILDEAELGFHPEWQRNFISMLVDFVNSLSVVADHDFQIILTSHSPILLSDIPTCCCNYLEYKDKDGKTINVKNDQPETFSNNVFELYRNSFFLQNGLIGRFAAKKIEKLETDIKEGKDGVVQMINLIGDRRLKMYFEDLFMNSSKAKKEENELLIKEYQKRINKLRKQNNE